MTRRNRIFMAVLLIYAAGIGFMLYNMARDIDPRYRESAEEALVETSHVLAAMVEQDIDERGAIDTWRIDRLFRALYARPFEAQVFSVYKTRLELRLYITDSRGYVMYDSTGRHTDGDFSHWRDVSETLQGRYGARTTRDIAADPNTSVMYVAAPIVWRGHIVGVLTVGKPVQSFGQFVEMARANTIQMGIYVALALLVLALIISVWLVQPFAFVQAYWAWWRHERTLQPLRLVRGAVQQWRAVWSHTRETLAGRNYVADYVQTLAHEIKGPLSAIRGASELLQESLEQGMDERQRVRFLDNIGRETQRIQETVDRMMELSALETQRILSATNPVDMRVLLQEVVDSAQDAAAPRHVRVQLEGAAGENDAPVRVQGDAFLLRRAIGNLLDNALDFSPDGAMVSVVLHADASTVRVQVRDHGPGIPAYAKDKVFEKFYSLARPHTQKKSTGLGLAFVSEIVQLHHGQVRLDNASDGNGAVATLSLPLMRV